MGVGDHQRDATRRFLMGRRRREMTDEEWSALAAVMSPPVAVPARRTLIRAGEEVRVSTLLVSGFLCRYMDARDGYRQLVSVQVPGDFVDLHGYPLRRLDHDVATLTPVEIATVAHDDLTALVERFPHFLCETYARLHAVGLAADHRFDLPLTQQDLGEATGLTSVHVNRTLRRLREGGLVEIAAREVRILDWPRLAACGEFDPAYLYFED